MTNGSVPAWVTDVPSVAALHKEPPLNYQWQSMTEDQLRGIRQKLIQSILQVINLALTGVLTPGSDQFKALQDWVSGIPILGDIVDALTGSSGDLADLEAWALKLLGPDSPLNASNLFGSINDAVLHLIPLSSISLFQPNLLTAPAFDFVENVLGAAGFAAPWDGTVGRTTLGSSTMTGDGAHQWIQSNPVRVAEGDPLTVSVWAKWLGLDFTGTPFELQIARYLGDTLVTVDNVAAPTSPGANQSAWTQLTSSYTVPSGCDTVRVQFHLFDTVTAGQVWFDDADLHKSGLLKMAWTQGLPEAIQAGIQALQDLIDTIWQAITRLTGVDKLLADITDALQNFPNLNVLPYGGGINIGESLQATWDSLVSGSVGTTGVGSVLSDLNLIGFLTNSRAKLGEYAYDILSVRNNKPQDQGFLPTSESNFPLSLVGFQGTAPTLPITATSSLMTVHTIGENVYKAAVGWYGYFTGTITDFRVNIWKMDVVTGALTLVHNSTNQSALLSNVSSPPPHVVYPLPAPLPVTASDVYLIERALSGSGTYNIVGESTWIGNHPSIFPKNWAATRSAGAGSISLGTVISGGSVVPSSSVPWTEFAKDPIATSAVFLPHSPEPWTFSTPGTGSLAIPSWCTHIDRVAVGAGGGGEGCGLLWGEGGHAGSWAGDRLQRGVDIPMGTTSLNWAVDYGGGGGGGIGADGDAGGASIVSGTGASTLIAFGGVGGSAQNADYTGKSPGSFEFPPGSGIFYVGGAVAASPYSNGNPAGGGGAGSGLQFVNAGTGAPGRVWIVFRQL